MARQRSSPGVPAPKTCASCGRTMSWRKGWERNWDEVRYCSDGCRRHKPDATDAALEQAILAVVGERAPTATACPSEAARQVGAEQWRDLMERSRSAGRRLAARGELLWTQGGRVVDPSTAKGPVRFRRP